MPALGVYKRTFFRGGSLMANQQFSLAATGSLSIEQVGILRNTYLLLSLTLLFSGAVAAFAMAMHAPALNIWVQLIGMFGLLFAVNATRNSALGLLMVFVFTGFLGYTLGPMLNAFMGMYRNGSELIMTALGGTGLIFMGLSAYAMTSRRNFNFMGSFLMVGLLVAIVASIANMFFHIAGLQLAVSVAVMVIMSGMILFDTSRIIHGGETNYISATVSLYLDIFNLFISLLQILGMVSGDRD
jgi:modulator of FtsH protease